MPKSTTNQTNKIDRLTMAEVVLDALLSVLVDKNILTRQEIQDQILRQVNDDSSGK